MGTEIEDASPANAGRMQDGRFSPGTSGNPVGKVKGTRNKTTLAVQALLDGEAEEITRKAIEAAKGGDMTAIRLVLERVLPARKDSPVAFTLPEISNAAAAAQVMGALLAAVAGGDITPTEGGEVAKLVDTYIKALEAHEYETRLRRLEEIRK